MEKQKRIYCIEGFHNWGDKEPEPSALPILEQLRRLGYWDYEFRTCATAAEAKFRLEHEWMRCDKGSILYFNTHGGRDQVWFSDDVSGLITLKEWIITAAGCYIHFGGCDTFSGKDYNVEDLMDATEAVAVSGYAREVNWLGDEAPGLLCDLALFEALRRVKFENRRKGRVRDLNRVRRNISTRFEDCKFNMLTRKYSAK